MRAEPRPPSRHEQMRERAQYAPGFSSSWCSSACWCIRSGGSDRLATTRRSRPAGANRGRQYVVRGRTVRGAHLKGELTDHGVTEQASVAASTVPRAACDKPPSSSRRIPRRKAAGVGERLRAAKGHAGAEPYRRRTRTARMRADLVIAA